MRSSAPDPWIDRVCDAMREHERERPRYEPLEEIGRGGMAVVYRARDHRIGRDVALKVMREDLDPQPEDRARFRREAEAAARLSHPNVVTLLDAGEEHGRLFLAMELVQGRPLHLVLERERPPLELIEKVARGVHHAHAHGIVHRDLKPSNILVTENGEPKVSDFGIAHLVDATRLTKSDALLGTPLYMAPEQVRGGPVSAQTDVYSLGAILYETTTGRTPHSGSTAVEIFRGILDDEPVPPRRIDPTIPAEVETICLKALEKNPARRYSTAQALAEDLRNVREGRPIEARPTSRLTRWWRKAQKHRAISLPIAAVLLASMGTGGGFGVSAVRKSRQIQRGLGSARVLESEERYLEARDALLGVLKLDLRNAEARRALERVEHQRELATARIDKARRIEDVLRKWEKFQAKLRQVEGVYYDSTSTLGERRLRNSTIWDADLQRAVAGETPQDPVSMAAMIPLQGWAVYLVLDEKSGMQMMRSGAQYDPEVPLSYLTEAFVRMDRYVEDLLWPGPAAAPPPWEPSGEGPDGRSALREVRPLLEKAEAAPSWGEAIGRDYRLALAALQAIVKGEPAAAEEALNRAIASDHIDMFRRTLLLLRAKMRAALGKFKEGEQDLREAAEVRAEYATIFGLRGVLRSAQGRTEEAIRAFGEALARDPRSAAAYLGRGNVWARGESPEKAIADYVQAMKLDRGLTLACHNRGSMLLAGSDARAGRLYLNWGRVLGTREPYVRAVAILGEADPAGLGEAYLALGNPEAAIENFTRAGDRASRGWAYSCLAAAQEARGIDPSASYEKALADFESVNPPDANLLHFRAKTHLRRGNYPHALRDLDRALDLDPALVDLRRTRGLLYQDWARGNGAALERYALCDNAIADFTAVLERSPQSAEDYLLRGRAYLLLSTLPDRRDWWQPPMKAIADFEAALRCRPESIVARVEAGLAHLRTAWLQDGHRLDGGSAYYERAISHFDDALLRDPFRWDLFLWEGFAYERLGRPAKAAACYQKSRENRSP